MSYSIDAVTINVSSTSDVRVPYEYHAQGSYSFRNLGPSIVFVAEKAPSSNTPISDGNNSVRIGVGEVVQINLSENFATINPALFARGVDGPATLKTWRSA